MTLKRMAAVVALLFAAWEAYVAISFIWAGRVLMFWMALRLLIVGAIMAGAVLIFLGRSIWWLAAGAFGALLWEARNIAFFLPALFNGVWSYKWSDWTFFVPMFSPPLSLLLLLIADGRGKRFATLARRWRPAELD